MAPPIRLRAQSSAQQVAWTKTSMFRPPWNHDSSGGDLGQLGRATTYRGSAASPLKRSNRTKDDTAGDGDQDGECVACMQRMAGSFCGEEGDGDGGGLDPYVRVSLLENVQKREVVQRNEAPFNKYDGDRYCDYSYETKPIFGGGQNVEFCEADHNTFTFKLKNPPPKQENWAAYFPREDEKGNPTEVQVFDLRTKQWKKGTISQLPADGGSEGDIVVDYVDPEQAANITCPKCGYNINPNEEDEETRQDKDATKAKTMGAILTPGGGKKGDRAFSRLWHKSMDKYTGPALRVGVYDEDVGADRLCGEITVPLNYVFSYAEQQKDGEEPPTLRTSVPVFEALDGGANQFSGHVELTATYTKETRTLVIEVVSATKISPPDEVNVDQLLGVGGGIFFICYVMLFGEIFYVMEPSVNTFWEGCWFMLVTVSSVGYGDFYPTEDPVRWLNIFVIFSGVVFVGFLFTKMTEIFINMNDDKQEAARNMSDEAEGTADKKESEDEDLRCFGYLRYDMFAVLRSIAIYYLFSYLFFRFYPGWAFFGDNRPEYCSDADTATFKEFHGDCISGCMDPGESGVLGTLSGTYGLVLNSTQYQASTLCTNLCSDVSNVCSGRFVSDAMILEFIVVTMSTVGYGNIAPQTNLGRMVWSVGLLLGIVLLGRFASVCIDDYLDRLAKEKSERLMANSLCSIEELAQYDEDGDGTVDKFEWLKVMLPKLEFCTPDQIDQVMKRFDDIDVDGSGEITIEDFIEFQNAQKAKDGGGQEPGSPRVIVVDDDEDEPGRGRAMSKPYQRVVVDGKKAQVVAEKPRDDGKVTVMFDDSGEMVRVNETDLKPATAQI